MKKIKIKYFDQEIDRPTKIDKGDWIDLRSAITVTLNAGDYKAIPLGVGMELPRGYEAYIAPRGSTYKNFSVIITNSWGVVDESFKGDGDQWHCLVYALQKTIIKKGDKICQFRIQKHMPNFKFEVVETLGKITRGFHGTTGKS